MADKQYRKNILNSGAVTVTRAFSDPSLSDKDAERVADQMRRVSKLAHDPKPSGTKPLGMDGYYIPSAQTKKR